MRKRRMTRLGAIGLPLVLTAGVAGGDFDLAWHTVDGGGAVSTSGADYALSGTIGQPDAHTTMTGGDFALRGGFWPGAAAGDAPDCPEDLDGDGEIALGDLSILLGNFGQPGDPGDGDLDGDGEVALADLSILLGVYGTDCP